MWFRWIDLMAHEEQTSRFSKRTGAGAGGGGSGGCKLSKKLKHKKVPQRGMGVAQLEKIILEKRQLKEAGVMIPDSVRFRRPEIPLPLPEIPLPPPLPPNRHPLISKSDGMSSEFVHMSSGSGNIFCRLYNFDGENLNSNQNLYLITMPANQGSIHYESNPSILQQFATQRSQFEQPCSSSMVNVSLGTSSSPPSTILSVMDIQIEPPSIQSYCSNKYSSFQPDGDKMVESKRSYPFSTENIPIPSFNCNIPCAYVSSISKSNESASSLELNIPFSRENPLRLGSIRDEKTKKFNDENRDFAKDFLTLAPPQSSPHSHSNLQEKLLPLSLGELNQPSYQGQTRESEWLNQQPLHNFFPAAKTIGTSNGEVGEHIDLSLKL